VHTPCHRHPPELRHEGLTEERAKWIGVTDERGDAALGLGHIVALHYRSSTLYQIRYLIWSLCF
jgi:hypothetical protein